MGMTVRYTVINGEVIAEKRNGVRRLYVPDPLGSTVALLDNVQTQTDTFSYWPYGEESARTGTTATPFRYLGGFAFTNGGLQKPCLGSSYIDLGKARWMNGLHAAHKYGRPNRYEFIGNSPLSLPGRPLLDRASAPGIHCRTPQPGLLRYAGDTEAIMCLIIMCL